MRVDGRDLNFRPRVNQRLTGTTIRRLGALVPSLDPNTAGTRPTISRGKSQYDALILSARRRMSHGVDFGAWYTLSKAPEHDRQRRRRAEHGEHPGSEQPVRRSASVRPERDDGRASPDHRVGGVPDARVDSWCRRSTSIRSALPVDLIDGRDLNRDGDINDIPARAFVATRLQRRRPNREHQGVGECKTVNCGRLFSQSYLNVRMSKTFTLKGRMRIEAIAEVFNLFNALNPSNGTATNRRVTDPTTGLADTTLLQPTSFSGDFQRPEQRVGQIGFRFLF